jgi:hypothetical protein
MHFTVPGPVKTGGFWETESRGFYCIRIFSLKITEKEIDQIFRRTGKITQSLQNKFFQNPRFQKITSWPVTAPVFYQHSNFLF